MPVTLVQAVGLVGWAVIWGAVAGLVYRDAAADGRVSAVAWTLVVFVFGILGLIAYKASDWISFTRS